MAKKKPRPDTKLAPRLSKRQAEVAFREAFAGGSVVYSKHARKRMKQDKVDATDLIGLSHNGFVHREGEPDIKMGGWNYTIESPLTALKVAFAVEKPDVIIIIPVINPQERKKRGKK